MFEILFPLLMYYIFYLIFKAVASYLKNASEGQGALGHLKTLLMDELNSLNETHIEPEDIQLTLDDIEEEEEISVFSETFEYPEENISFFDENENFESDIFSENDELYDDIILEVDRSLQKKNIKDPRSLINRRTLRKSIIIKEILDKPKSFN